MQTLARTLACLAIMAFSSSFYWGNIDKVSATVVSRQVQKGKSITIKNELYYRSNGVLISHYTFPKEYILVTNKLGESKLYNPADNTVYQTQSQVYSSQASAISYFLTGRSSDMGLPQIGYVPETTTQEGDLLVTMWKLKTPNKKELIQRLKTVYNRQQSPVYVDYRNATGQVIRKVFYYNYQPVGGLLLPGTTTEIIYDKGDSTITRTTYDDFRVNEAATSQYFDFTIPKNAKSIH